MLLFLAILALLLPAPVRAQEPAPPTPPLTPPPTPPDQSGTRPTGLPPRIDWTFNLDAGWGSFGFANSLYDNPKDEVDENLSDQWFEGYAKPALSGRYAVASAGELYGKVSLVGERTYGAAPTPSGPDISSFGWDDASIGWRLGTSIGNSENLFDFTVGRSQYRLGNGFLVMDGAAEGGTRGGYWSNARKAFEVAAIARVKPGPHTGELFYLDRDELDESESGTRLWGANYELSLGDNTTVGATYMKFFAHADVRPERDGLDVFNVRTYASPFAAVPDLSFELEYAAERNQEALDSNAWTVLGAYELSAVAWTPRLSYRYAFFQGDDPDTSANEAFDPLFPGFNDWGAWWQGEIAGEYFLSNSNLISHQVRVHVAPTDRIGAGAILYKFLLDQPASFGPEVTSEDVAFEADFYVDWEVSSTITLSLLGAFADPGAAVQQSSDRTKNFAYGMVYVTYSF